MGNQAGLFAAMAFPAPVVNGADSNPGFLNLINALFGSAQPEPEIEQPSVATTASPKQIAQALMRSMFKVEKELESIDAPVAVPVSVNAAPIAPVVQEAPSVRRDFQLAPSTDLEIGAPAGSAPHVPAAGLAFTVRLTPHDAEPLREPLPDRRGTQEHTSHDGEGAVGLLDHVPQTVLSAAAPAIEQAPAPAAVTTKVDAPCTSVPQALHTSEPVATAPAVPNTTPVQEIAVRIARPEQPTVDLHLIERAGQIHVDVRTPDAALQVTLRHDLGTLAGSLERVGYHTDIFSPKDAVAALSSSSQTSLNDETQQESRDPRRWRWFEDLEKEL
jgi:hypothetical protein